MDWGAIIIQGVLMGVIVTILQEAVRAIRRRKGGDQE